MSKIDEIAEGWGNMFKKSVRILDLKIVKLSKERYAKCKPCAYNNNDFKCDKCGCFLRAKLVSTKSKCPIGKW